VYVTRKDNIGQTQLVVFDLYYPYFIIIYITYFGNHCHVLHDVPWARNMEDAG